MNFIGKLVILLLLAGPTLAQVATPARVGLAKPGTGLAVDASGTFSVTVATGSGGSVEIWFDGTIEGAGTQADPLHISAAILSQLTSLTAVPVQTHTTGAAVTISAGIKRLDVNPATVLSALAITLPASPVNGQSVSVVFGGTITTGAVVSSISFVGPILLTEPVSGEMVAGDVLTWVYRSSDSKWFLQNL